MLTFHNKDSDLLTRLLIKKKKKIFYFIQVDFSLKYTEKFSSNSNMMPEESSSTLTHQRESSNIETIPPTLPSTGSASASGSFEAQSQKKSKSTKEDCVFFLPDLNMTPSED